MKLIPVTYYGFTAMDRRFSSPMLPWIVSEIRKRDYCEKLSLGIEDGVLQAYNPDFELQFSHKIWQVTRFSQADQDPTTFLYLMRDDNDALLYCYLFQAKKTADALHVVDRVLDPMLDTPFANPTAFDLLENAHHWKLGGRKVSNFFKRVQFNNKEDLFRKPGGHTFFVPIDDTKHDHRLQNIDNYIIDGHVTPHMVLFTRPARKNFAYETAANGDYVYIVLSMPNHDEKDYVKSHTILGNGQHRKGEILAEIVKGNIPVENGVVHLISQPLAVFDRELRPFPYLSVWYKISADPFLNISYVIGQMGRVNQIIKREREIYTYFAPRDRSWKNYTGYSKEELGDILGRHLIVSDTRYTMSKLATTLNNNGTTLETLGGTIRVNVVYTNGSYFLVWGQNWIKVHRPDYECNDGVVHIIDGVFATPKPAVASTPSETKNFWKTLKYMVI